MTMLTKMLVAVFKVTSVPRPRLRNSSDQHCVDQYKRLAGEIEQVELSNFSDREQDV